MISVTLSFSLGKVCTTGLGFAGAGFVVGAGYFLRVTTFLFEPQLAMVIAITKMARISLLFLYIIYSTLAFFKEFSIESGNALQAAGMNR